MSGSQYFRRPHPVLMAVILFLIILEMMCVFTPGSVPYNLLGPFGMPVSYIVFKYPDFLQFTFLIGLILNAVTGIVAYSMAGSKGITNPARLTWCLYCSLFGLFSLRHLHAFSSRNTLTNSEQTV